jgi:hypothetical protein
MIAVNREKEEPMKCVMHAAWAVNRRAQELEDERTARGVEEWRVSHADDPELIKAARQAPDAEVLSGQGMAICMPCFVKGEG